MSPFAGLFVLLILFAGGGMFVIAGEADRSDAARARKGVELTFAAARAQLDAAAEMNARTTPVADLLLGPAAEPSSAHAFFTFTNRAAMGFYGTLVLNHDGSAFAGTRAGRPLTGPALAAAARLVAPVAARLPDHGRATARALLRDGDGRVVAVAATNAVAGEDGAIDAVPGFAPRRLAMISPVDEQLIPKILPSLGVEHFRVTAAAGGDSATIIPVEGGPPLIFAWQPSSPGQTAIQRWIPAIVVILSAAFALLVLALRSSLATARQLEWLALHDSLTGLPNRSAFRSELDRRLSEGGDLAVGMSDLNGFKTINDRHGHPTGDELLRSVAVKYLDAAGADDFVARLGGDEFAWISPSIAAAERLATGLRTRLDRPLAAGDLKVHVGVAIGIAAATRGGSAPELMKLADQDLYRSKAHGRAIPGTPAATVAA